MQSKWQHEFFRGLAIDFLKSYVNIEQTIQEVGFLERALAPPAGGRILDVPCGLGRHAIEFGRRGYRVSGIDLSVECLTAARHAAGEIPVQWLRADMSGLPLAAAFDGAYCFGNSFGYLDQDGARAFLAGVAAGLKPGGRFVMETGMAAESILPTLLQRRWYNVRDMHLLSENEYHAAESRLDIRYTFIRSGQVETRASSSYVRTIAEICRLHADAGLEVLQLAGSIAGEPYRMGSPGLIVVSQSVLRSADSGGVPRDRFCFPAITPAVPGTDVFEFGGFRLETATRLLSRAGRRVPLAPKIVDLLVVLVEHHGQLVSKESLMDRLWGDSFVEDGNLAKMVFVLRQCLKGDARADVHIETIPKRGYRLNGWLRRIPAAGLETTMLRPSDQPPRPGVPEPA